MASKRGVALLRRRARSTAEREGCECARNDTACLVRGTELGEIGVPNPPECNVLVRESHIGRALECDEEDDLDSVTSLCWFLHDIVKGRDWANDAYLKARLLRDLTNERSRCVLERLTLPAREFPESIVGRPLVRSLQQEHALLVEDESSHDDALNDWGCHR